MSGPLFKLIFLVTISVSAFAEIPTSCGGAGKKLILCPEQIYSLAFFPNPKDTVMGLAKNPGLSGWKSQDQVQALASKVTKIEIFDTTMKCIGRSLRVVGAGHYTPVIEREIPNNCPDCIVFKTPTNRLGFCCECDERGANSG